MTTVAEPKMGLMGHGIFFLTKNSLDREIRIFMFLSTIWFLFFMPLPVTFRD